jgi:hypothetical protein
MAPIISMFSWVCGQRGYACTRCILGGNPPSVNGFRIVVGIPRDFERSAFIDFHDFKVIRFYISAAAFFCDGIHVRHLNFHSGVLGDTQFVPETVCRLR